MWVRRFRRFRRFHQVQSAKNLCNLRILKAGVVILSVSSLSARASWAKSQVVTIIVPPGMISQTRNKSSRDCQPPLDFSHRFQLYDLFLDPLTL